MQKMNISISIIWNVFIKKIMTSSKVIINRYPKQAYSVIFNQSSGQLIRLEDLPGEEPLWCSYGPELLDISITNKCDRECKICYKKSNREGKNINIADLQMILRQASEMKVLQVALGGGNPNQHPDFCRILQLSREEYNIVPSYTTNGEGLNEEILSTTKKYCGAVAVSAYEPYDFTFSVIKRLTDYGIRTNIHYLLTRERIETAIEWLENPPKEFEKLNAIIFLNYKPIGRNPDQNYLIKNMKNTKKFFTLAGGKHNFKVGFDSCTISGVACFMNISPLFIDYCEAGRFSMYISEDLEMFPCSFMIDKFPGIKITQDNIQKEWINNEIFKEIRKVKLDDSCAVCEKQKLCSGGCRLFPQINFCKDML